MIRPRPLGETGRNISEIGFGTFPLSRSAGPPNDSNRCDPPGFAASPTDAVARAPETAFEAASEPALAAALEAALEAGIRYIDVCQSEGACERTVARVLAEVDPGGAILVASKCAPAAGPMPLSPYCRWQDRYGPAYLRDDVHERLERLGRESLGLHLLAAWTRAWSDDPQPLVILRRMKEEGKLALVGLCAPPHDPNCVIPLMQNGLVDVVEVPFNLLRQDAAAQLLPVAAETGTGVIVRAALEHGVLAGKYTAEHVFAEDDFRRRYFAGDRMGRATERVERIGQDVAQFGLDARYSLRDVAIKFALSRPEVSCVVVGMRSAAQVKQNAASAALPDLPEALQHVLRRHHWPRDDWSTGK